MGTNTVWHTEEAFEAYNNTNTKLRSPYFSSCSMHARLQPLDAFIISVIKRKYHNIPFERAIYLLEEKVPNNLHTTDLYMSMSVIYDIWSKEYECTTYNFFAKTGLLVRRNSSQLTQSLVSHSCRISCFSLHVSRHRQEEAGSSLNTVSN